MQPLVLQQGVLPLLPRPATSDLLVHHGPPNTAHRRKSDVNAVRQLLWTTRDIQSFPPITWFVGLKTKSGHFYIRRKHLVVFILIMLRCFIILQLLFFSYFYAKHRMYFLYLELKFISERKLIPPLKGPSAHLKVFIS